MKSFFLLLLASTVYLFFGEASAQISISSQSFDNPGSLLPSGWQGIIAANPMSPGWVIDSSASSSGYLGATGLKNAVIKNVDNSTGYYSLITSSISTLGYGNLQFKFASRVSNNYSASGSTTPSLYFSIDTGNTWLQIAYTDNAANSTWAIVNSGNPISLPSATYNKPSLLLKWTVHIDSASNGTYRIDDVDLIGTACSNNGSVTNDSICQGMQYSFGGNLYDSTGTYTIHSMNTLGCDSAAVLNLFVRSSSSSTTQAGFCPGNSYNFNGTTYTSGGYYTAHLLNSLGCDSAANLNLTAWPATNSTTVASVCSGSSYIFNGNSYNTSGSYTIHLANQFGCDSAALLQLSVSSGFTPVVSIQSGSPVFCAGNIASFTAQGINGGSNPTYQWYLNGSPVGSGGSTFNLTSPQTGDSVFCVFTSSLTCVNPGTNPANSNVLKIILHSPTTSSLFTSICQGDSVLFANHHYSLAGTYIAQLVNAAGCDSIATLHLTINQPSTSNTSFTICQGDSFLFNGTSYHQGGSYIAHLTNTKGCDSIAGLILSVISINTILTINNGGASATANQTGAQYSWIECSTRQAISGANGATFIPTSVGSYRCIITLNGCSDSSQCVTLGPNVGIAISKTLNQITSFPNPTSNKLNIVSNGAELCSIKIVDMTGQVLEEKNVLPTKQHIVDLQNYSSGIYLIQLKQIDGSLTNLKITKL